MATVTQVVYVDDLTKDPIPEGAEVHVEPLVVDGMFYELTLSAESRDELFKALEPFLVGADRFRAPKDLRARAVTAGEANRRATHNRAAEERQPTQRDKDQNRAMREWWAGNWKAAKLPEPKSNKGKIPDSVQDAYHKHQGMTVGNGTEAIREATNGAHKGAQPVFKAPEPRDVPYPSGDGGGVEAKHSTQGSSKAKKAPAKANGKSKDAGKVTVSKEDFLAAHRQAGGDVTAVADATKLSKAAVYARASAYRKSGDIPAK